MDVFSKAPTFQAPNWDVPLELMCGTSYFAIIVVLRQRIDKKTIAVYSASKALKDAQINYSTTKKNY